MSMDMKEFKPKSFWQRPEGVAGTIFLILAVVGGGILLYTALPYLITLAANALYLAGMLIVLGAVLYMVFDPKMRTLIAYLYKSMMRWITGVFVTIDPIGILKNYIDDLQNNLSKMDQQIAKLRGEMHRLKEIIFNNQKQIEANLNLASKARETNKDSIMILKSRSAGRLKDSNIRLEDLYKKMEVLYRVLTRMYSNSEILLEDVKDQVQVKEQERKVIRTSHSAMRSAMNIIAGDKDQRYMFDQALEAIADDVSKKVGEMERFMEMSSNFMDSMDLQNGIFEEEGIKMLEKWEREGVSLLLGEEKKQLLDKANDDSEVLDLNAPVASPVKVGEHRNQYDSFFD